jgi:drug/metabolite transporter (DMT)-like permease
MLCLYSALYMLPLADAVTINLIRPPLAALLAWLVLSESFPWLGWLGLAACLGGVALVAHPPFLFGGHQQWGATRLEGVAVDVASACFGAGGAGPRRLPALLAGWPLRRCHKQPRRRCTRATARCLPLPARPPAAVSVIIRLIGKSEPALTIALWFHTVSIAVCAPPLLLLGWPEAPVLPSWPQLALLGGVSLSSFTSQLLMTRSLQLLPAAQQSAISFLQVGAPAPWLCAQAGAEPSAAAQLGAAVAASIHRARVGRFARR